MIEFLIQIPYFLIASILFFVIPGSFIWQKTNSRESFWENLFLSTVIGFVSFTCISYTFLYFRIDYLILPLAILIALFWFKQNFSAFRKISLHSIFSFKIKKKHLLILLIFTLGILGQLAVISPSGIYLNENLFFWSSHGHDSSWHIALLEEIKKGYPLQNPVLAGEKLVNYHFFSDIAPAFFSKYFYITNLDSYFRFFPFLYSLLLGLSAYFLGKKLGNSYLSGLSTVFFVYFSGSFGYIVTYLQNKTIGGESIFWGTQIQSSSGNPPQIISNFIVLTFLYLFLLFLNKPANKVIIVCTIILAGSLAGFKIYASVVLLGSLGLLGIYQIIREKKFFIMAITLFSGLLSVAIYLPNSLNSTGFLIYEPWWYIRTMVVTPDHLNWLDMELRRQTYISEGNLKRVIQLELTAFLIFFFGNLGMKFLGFWQFIKMLKGLVKNYFSQLFILMIVISFIMPMLFLQKGVASNTSQFLQYFLLLFCLLSGVSVYQILNKLKHPLLKISIGLLIIILAVPTQVGLLYNFYNRTPVAKISKLEIEALSYLKDNSNSSSVILTAPYNRYLELGSSTPYIWDWSDSAYVAAFSSRRTYFSDMEQVDIMGYNFKERLNNQEFLFITNDPQEFIKRLKEDKITHLYFPKELRPKLDLSKTNLEKIYANNAVEIWKVN